MPGEKYSRQIKSVTGNGTTGLIIKPSAGKRVHAVQLNIGYAGGTNTLAAFIAILTEIRVKVGTVVKWRLSSTQLRDFLLLRGTTYDFNGLPNTGCQITIPLAPEWFTAVVQDSLAWDPTLLGGEISVELTASSALTVNKAIEFVDDSVGAPSSGIVTLEVIRPVAGGTEFYTGDELELRGGLVSASIYPDSGASNEITPAGLILGTANVAGHEDLTSAENDEMLERLGLTPAASGRTANIYDLVFVKDDMLSRAIDLAAWRKARLKIGAAAAMSGTCAILLCRLEK
jgi:hypothetical protein